MKIQDREADNNFTILRLLLALMVVFGHFHILAGIHAPPWPFNYAAAAVDCFFVVSGYLVSHSFDRDSNFRRFYLRRFFRIYPLYIVVVSIQTVVLASLAPGGIAANGHATMTYFGLNAVFANFAQHDIGGVLTGLSDPSLNASLWTLKIEFAFYLILPFLWLLTRRFGVAVLVAVFFASALYQELLRDAGNFQLAKQLPGQLQFFVLGIAAYRYRDRLTLSPTWGLILTPVLAALLTLELRPHPPIVYPLTVAAFVVVAALKAPHFKVRNDISYGVYLLHAPIIQLSLLFGLYRPGWDGLGIVVALVVALAICAERFIEIPGIAMGKRLAKQVTGGNRPAERPRADAMPVFTRSAESQ